MRQLTIINSEITNKPIAGFLTHQKYLDNLLTAVNNTSETLLVGQPITLKISATLKSSLARIDQNILEISETPIETNEILNGIFIGILNTNETLRPTKQAMSPKLVAVWKCSYHAV